MIEFSEAYSGRNVMVTGHTGFKGSWLCTWLKRLGANIIGVSNEIPTSPSLFELLELQNDVDDIRLDINDIDALAQLCLRKRPEVIFHLAAQALVHRSLADPHETFLTNAMGTASILEAVRRSGIDCKIVVITSDKCYANNEWIWGYRESDRLGGLDPYSASKAAAELVFYSYAHTIFKGSGVVVASARAGNVIGGGDWASNRLVPDCVRAWSRGKVVKIRNPSSTRPWQHVLEPLSGYLCLGQYLMKESEFHGQSFNFGPSADSNHQVQELVEEMARTWPAVSWEKEVLYAGKIHSEAALLKLVCDKAHTLLGWRATLDFEETVKFTSDWYRKYSIDAQGMREFTREQIESYVHIAKKKVQAWAV